MAAVTKDQIAIRCHALDLARRPTELLDQVVNLAATIAANGRAQTRRGVA